LAFYLLFKERFEKNAFLFSGFFLAQIWLTCVEKKESGFLFGFSGYGFFLTFSLAFFVAFFYLFSGFFLAFALLFLSRC